MLTIQQILQSSKFADPLALSMCGLHASTQCMRVHSVCVHSTCALYASVRNVAPVRCRC
jgi:hypothetical protein